MKQRGEAGCRLRLQQTGFGKGVRSALTDDEVIHHPDIDHGQGGFQPFRERAIGGRGLGHPDGCWCARINAEALRAKARWTTTRGYPRSGRPSLNSGS